MMPAGTETIEQNVYQQELCKTLTRVEELMGRVLELEDAAELAANERLSWDALECAWRAGCKFIENPADVDSLMTAFEYDMADIWIENYKARKP